MKDTVSSTRVLAPAYTRHSSQSVRGATMSSIGTSRTFMKKTTQISLRDGVCLNTTKTAVEPKKLFRVATWNVLTLAREGYVDAITKEMSRFNVSMAGLTEARIPGNDLTAYD